MTDQKVLLRDVFPDFEALWGIVCGIGAIKSAMEIAGVDRSRAALEQATKRFRQPDGSVVLNSWEHFVTCTK